jgi:hypothetical protein
LFCNFFHYEYTTMKFGNLGFPSNVSTLKLE